MTSVLGNSLVEALMRLLPPMGADVSVLEAVVLALTDALEQGELGIHLKGETPDGITAEQWPKRMLQALEASGWMVSSQTLNDKPEAPIVHDGDWLRWRRWHQDLDSCLQRLLELGECPMVEPPPPELLETCRIQAEEAGLDGCQCDAVITLLQRRLVLLTGGPGTGKTSTVVQMLAAALRRKPDLRIQLSAPTGKAASRLLEAVTLGGEGLEPEQAKPLTQLTSCTLHRLLEAQGEGRFRRNQQTPLDLDLLVVDEFSMVDLPLMGALLDAMPAHGQLLLVGDANQLPPVGPGAVLQELIQPQRLQRLGTAAVELRTTYRNDGAIAVLASQLREGMTGLDRTCLSRLKPNDNVTWLEAPSQALPSVLVELLLKQQECLKALARSLRWQNDDPHPDDVAALLGQLEAEIALSPVRQGPWGVEAIHRALLGELSRRPVQHWPAGTPVLNRHNRPEQGLANGDIGVMVQRDQHSLVLLPGGRLLHPAQLSGAEPAFALTVHKSQGSQYGRVALLLPPTRYPDPRLAYTGLTRARSKVLLITPLISKNLAGSEQPRHA